jgi:hypothetical protein
MTNERQRVCKCHIYLRLQVINFLRCYHFCHNSNPRPRNDHLSLNLCGSGLFPTYTVCITSEPVLFDLSSRETPIQCQTKELLQLHKSNHSYHPPHNRCCSTRSGYAPGRPRYPNRSPLRPYSIPTSPWTSRPSRTKRLKRYNPPAWTRRRLHPFPRSSKNPPSRH